MTTRSNALLRASLRRERRTWLGALGAGVGVALSTIGLSGTSAWLIVRAAQRPAILTLTLPMGLVQLFALSKAAGRYLERTQTHRAALSSMGHVRATVARTLAPLLPAGLGPRSADAVDLVLGDVERVQDLLTAVAGPLATSVAAGLVTVVITGALVPLAGLTLLLALVLGTVALPWLAEFLGRRGEEELATLRRAMQDLWFDAASANDELVFGSARTHLRQRLGTLEDRYDRLRARQGLRTGVVQGLGVALAGVAVSVLVLTTASALVHHELTRVFVAVPALLGVSALELVNGVTPSIVKLRGDTAALARLEALRDVAPPVHEPASPATPSGVNVVRLDHVAKDFDDHEVLWPSSLTLDLGELVVLEGRSGSGKTTLARLIVKFLDPSAGHLTLGDVDYRDLRGRQVREVVGFVDDEPHVFTTTLAGNLRVARPTASDDELLDALERSGLGPLARRMVDGLATELGVGQAGLSGGEQRRLGLARELLRQRPFLVVDEPTEGLDEASAEAVMRTLTEPGDRGVLVISHREVDRRYATRTWRLEAGRLEDGH